MNRHKPKILIIDDDPVVSSLMTGILKTEGYELFFAIDGRDGLDKTMAIHPDLIFLDICMPVLDGIGFLKELNERGPLPCPVLVISGFDDDALLSESFDQGIFSLIRKPFRSSEIIALCRRYTRVTEIKKHLSFNLNTVDFLNTQAASFGLDNRDEQNLMEALPLPVFVKNREQVVVWVNRALEEFTGLSREQMLGKRCEDFGCDQEFLTRNHENERVLFADGGVFRHEEMMTDHEGRQREVIIYRSALNSATGSKPVAILGVMVDITEFGFSFYKKMLVNRFPSLSVRECEVANLVRLGMSNKDVARQLNIALCTVEYHRANLREKLGLEKGANINLSTALLSL